ncbi:hypothetical protein BMF94_1273 [Rhodotorula taiwanensis]|uniref:F-box domain-containing protein n=1 Tax=Rhodotorula taiwanensis TaxID=741276 RepID=A0A2S5BFW6_9BASI|nr:hypothetical protein BMF94_1273 [Rhodotorula taiwanensis]
MTDRDRPLSLLSLPDELIENIVDKAIGCHPTPINTLLICRRILPLAHRILYHTVVLRSSFQQRALRATLERNPRLRPWIKILVLHGITPATPEVCERQRALLSMATSVEHLYLSEYSNVLLTALAHDATWSKGWTKLRTFRLRGLEPLYHTSPDEAGDPVKAVEDLWRLLGRFPTLQQVAIRSAADGTSFFPTIASTAASFPSIHSFHASGPLTMMPNLKVLSLSPAPRRRRLPIPPASVLTKASATLSHLTIGHQHIGANLQRFPALTFLRLEPDSFDPDTVLPCLLSSATLEEIVFGYGAPVSAALLRGLVIHCATLRRLTLDYDRSPARGKALQDLFVRLSVNNVDRFIDGLAELRQRSRPRRTVGSEADLRDILSLAADRKIDVTGSALTCLDWEAYFDDKAAAYLVNLARSTRDADRIDAVGATLVRNALVNDQLGPIQQYLGREGALQAFQRHRPSLSAFFESSFGPETATGGLVDLSGPSERSVPSVPLEGIE